jgi:hypothetical protein
VLRVEQVAPLLSLDVVPGSSVTKIQWLKGWTAYTLPNKCVLWLKLSSAPLFKFSTYLHSGCHCNAERGGRQRQGGTHANKSSRVRGIRPGSSWVPTSVCVLPLPATLCYAAVGAGEAAAAEHGGRAGASAACDG